MSKLYSAVEAAKELEKRGRTGHYKAAYSRVSIAWMARTYGIGQKVANRWVFSEEDIDALFDLPRQGDARRKQGEPPPGESSNPVEEVSPAPTAAA
jgi:hypothetical protein